MEQAKAFLEESLDLNALLGDLGSVDLSRSTGFKAWSIETILRHLHFWNQMALWALEDTPQLQETLVPIMEGLKRGDSLTEVEAQVVSAKGSQLVSDWRLTYQKLAQAYSQADPAQRCPWVGPSMSARSCITARQMETWAHGQAIYDELGRVRENTDRLQNIIILGINTFGWTFKVLGEAAPEQMPYVELAAPSGRLWTFGEENSGSAIKGAAEEFAQVVTQTRHVEDTQLSYEGEDAKRWLYNAQCFAGGPNPPPAPGSRFMRTK